MANLWRKNHDGSLVSRDHMGFNFQNLVDDFFTGLSHVEPWENFRTTGFMPKINVSETENAYKVMAELPGLEEKDFDVTLEDDILRIKGEKKSESEENKENFHRYESSYGSFERVIRLPETVDASACKADFKNGVLTLNIPKSKQDSRVHKIKVGSQTNETNSH